MEHVIHDHQDNGATSAILAVLLLAVVLFLGYMIFRGGFNFGRNNTDSNPAITIEVPKTDTVVPRDIAPVPTPQQ